MADDLTAALEPVRDRSMEAGETRDRLAAMLRGDPMPDLTSGPVVTGTTCAAFTVPPQIARAAALTVAERAPDDIPLLLDMLGITGTDGPGDGQYASYMYGRPRRRET